ncbi:EF-Hand 1, calcium-binding site [Phytophthora cactorum]|nr:EF-Hand 1, calcium-binding site [Phytophthora cactorum]
MTDSYLGSSCRGSIRSCEFQSSNNSAASPVSARNALLSASSINALVTDRELFTTAASVVPKLRSVVEHRRDIQQPPCWVVKKKQHGAEISEFDRAKLPSMRSIDGSNWFRGSSRVADSRHSMIESRRSIYTRNAFLGEHTQSEIRARELLQWPLNDLNVTYAVSAQVTLNCRLGEAMTMLFSRESLQFDASMGALFGARKYKSGDLLVSREFRKNLAMDYGDESSPCWEDEDLNDLSQPGWVALQSVVLRSRRSLNPMAAAKHTNSPKPMHDKFTHRREPRTSEQAIRGDMDHIAAGYHLMSSYSDLNGHQTRIIMTAYVYSSATDASRARSRFWAKGQPGVGSVSSRRHYAAPTANAEAKYVVNLLAAATTSFEQLPFLLMPENHDRAQDNRCHMCLKNFGLLRPQRFCQLCAQRVCRECSRKFDVEPIARRVRRNRICFACVANVDASVFQQENPLLNTSFPRASIAEARTNTTDPADEVDAKISTAFYDILLKTNNVARNSQSTDKASTSQTAYEAQMHRLDRSSSAATASTSFSSTPGRQLADALFSSDALTRARALEIVRQVVKQYPDRKMVDKYLEARLHLSSISLSGDPTVMNDSSDIPRTRPSSFYNLQEVTRAHDAVQATFCGAATMATTTNLETELDLDDDLDSAALDSICEVAAIRMRCSIAYIVALNARNSHAQRIVGSSGAPRPWTEEVTVCPLPLVANDKPFVIKDPARDAQLRHLRLVRDFACASSPVSPSNRPTASSSLVSREKISLEDLKAMHVLSKLASDLFEEEELSGYAYASSYASYARAGALEGTTDVSSAASSASQAERNVVQQWDGLGGLRDDGGGLGVAILMHRDAPSSDVECGSSGDSWWTSPKLEQRGHYTLLKELGEEMLAAKIFDPKSSSMETIQAEIDILRYLGAHRNIVSLHDVLYLKDETIMLTDLVEGGELFDYIVDMAYITLTGVHPFDPRGDKSDAEIVKEIANGKYDVENKWYKSLTAEVKDFLTRLLDSDPAKRLTAKQALQHSWLSGITTSAEPLDSGYTNDYSRISACSNFHAKLGKTSGANEKRLTSHRTATVNMDMFKETFSLFDKDESGCIDRDELKSMLLALGQQLSSSEIDEIMRQADTDGDGKISFTEFVSMMNERLFRRGDLTTGDLKAAFDIIQAADKNEDGKIDYDEFCALMQQQQQQHTKS